MLLQLIILSILLISSDALLEIDTMNGTFTIVNVHLHLEDLWTDNVTFNGKIERGTVGEFYYYNISNFVFFDMEDTTYLFLHGYEEIVKTQDLGAKYVVIREKLDPPGRRYIFQRLREGVKIPVVAIQAGFSDEFYMALNESIGMDVSVTAMPDVNTWTEFKNILLVFNILLVLLSGIPPAIAIYKITQFYGAGQCTLSISIVCLTINLIGDILRMTGVILDPFSLTSMDQYVIGKMLLAYPLVFLISSGLLITFYWAEILNDKSTNITSFLTSFRIPFYTIIIILLIINITFAILPLVIPNFDVQAIVVGVDFLVILFTGIFYTVVGSKIYKKVKALNTPSNVTKLILAAGVWILILTFILLAYVILSVTIEWQYRVLDLTIFMLLWISRFGISAVFSYIFNPQTKKKTKGTKSMEYTRTKTLHKD